MNSNSQNHQTFTAAIRLTAILLLFMHITSSCNFLKEKHESLIDFIKKRMSGTETSHETSHESNETDNDIMMIHAFGQLYFGMEQSEVSQLNENRQRLGKHDYNFSYSYDGDGRLYELTVYSDQTKALTYETGIAGKYHNLYDIISMKYGKPSGSKYVPSIFDVMDAGTIWINQWQLEGKELILGVRERRYDSYDVVCRITELEMDQQEKERLFKVKNKDKIEASDKF